MKLPSVGQDKSGVLLVAIAAGGYILYRMFGAASSIKETIGNSLGNAVKSVESAVGNVKAATVDNMSIGNASLARLVTGDPTQTSSTTNSYGDDQSPAETARLNRQDQSIVDSLPMTTTPTYDAMGSYTGDTTTADFPVVGGVAQTYDAVPSMPSHDNLGSVSGAW